MRNTNIKQIQASFCFIFISRIACKRDCKIYLQFSFLGLISFRMIYYSWMHNWMGSYSWGKIHDLDSMICRDFYWFFIFFDKFKTDFHESEMKWSGKWNMELYERDELWVWRIFLLRLIRNLLVAWKLIWKISVSTTSFYYVKKSFLLSKGLLHFIWTKKGRNLHHERLQFTFLLKNLMIS